LSMQVTATATTRSTATPAAAPMTMPMGNEVAGAAGAAGSVNSSIRGLVQEADQVQDVDERPVGQRVAPLAALEVPEVSLTSVAHGPGFRTVHRLVDG